MKDVDNWRNEELHLQTEFAHTTLVKDAKETVLCIASQRSSASTQTRPTVRTCEKHQDVRHDISRSRFVLALETQKKKRKRRGKDGEPETEAYLAYITHKGQGTFDIYHTWTPPAARGKGCAARLCAAAVSYATQEGLTVVPSCSYVRDTYLPNTGRAEDASIVADISS
mmetsp:Transcript_40671/g.68101  ORF Transcript_40671/g.68101 Transcript_40671/m.68101 type:complete len:169 (+) Transcript_40671:332-838(+)